MQLWTIDIGTLNKILEGMHKAKEIGYQKIIIIRKTKTMINIQMM